ncbi:MAG: preprotein translocase subunit SecE [Clostridia bacterium]|nr:preprotein translocase subunit SecE [Clostridia bacterium]
MAKNKQLKPQTLEQNTSIEAEKKQNAKVKETKEDKKEKKAKAKKEKAPKRSRIKETFGELKKVTWPTFGKTMAQTGMVIAVVAIFGVLVFGIDALLSWLFGLIAK